jgi:hypothetical protein
MDMRRRRPLHTDQSLAASFHGLCDGQAIAIGLPGGQAKRSFMYGGRVAVSHVQCRSHVGQSIQPFARGRHQDQKLRFSGSPRFPSGQSRDFGGLITVRGTSGSIETGFVEIGQRTAERIANTHTHKQATNI